MDWAGDVEITVSLGHIDDGLSIDVCFVVTGCEMVEISAKVRIKGSCRGWWREKDFKWGREVSKFVFSASENLVVVLAGKEQPV